MRRFIRLEMHVVRIHEVPVEIDRRSMSAVGSASAVA